VVSLNGRTFTVTGSHAYATEGRLGVAVIGRSPSAQEEQSWLPVLVSGARPAQIAAAFLSSDEFLNRQVFLDFGP